MPFIWRPESKPFSAFKYPRPAGCHRVVGSPPTQRTANSLAFLRSLFIHGVDGSETNIPFSRKPTLTFVNSEEEVEREALKVNLSDFWATIRKKYLDFLLCVCTMLQTQERAAIVVPYNPLFAGRGVRYV